MVSFCELCGAKADLHCAADSAFLCHSCDAKFHATNFLFARHFRRIICPNCKSLTGDFVSGPLLAWPPTTTCCSSGSSSSSSSASSCCSSLDRVSSSELSSTTRAASRAEVRSKERVKAVAVTVTVTDGIFVNWCGKLGLNRDLTNAVVSYASLALATERPRATKRMILAAAFWFGVRNACKTTTRQSLKKVEDVTGVSAGMIRTVESKLARAMTLQLRRWRVDSKEGWAENDNV